MFAISAARSLSTTLLFNAETTIVLAVSQRQSIWDSNMRLPLPLPLTAVEPPWNIPMFSSCARFVETKLSLMQPLCKPFKSIQLRTGRKSRSMRSRTSLTLLHHNSRLTSLLCRSNQPSSNDSSRSRRSIQRVSQRLMLHLKKTQRHSTRIAAAVT